MSDIRTDAPVRLVQGDDEVILRPGRRPRPGSRPARRPGSGPRRPGGAERCRPADRGEASIVPLVDAARTPFLTDRRVVVGSDLDVFTRADQVAPLVGVPGRPAAHHIAGAGVGDRPHPQVGDRPVKACGGQQVDTSPGRKVAAWVDEHVAAAGIKLDRGPSTGWWRGWATIRSDSWACSAPWSAASGPGPGWRRRRRAVPGRAGGRAAVGADRRPRQGRHRRRPRQAPPHDRRRRSPPLQVMATLTGTTAASWPSTAPRSPARRTLPSCWA